ncbi:uncharacterized protein MELLADRAFT_103129 [Melampsora larici-populina 98AG31]|uniref:CxC1-like cysteine cluster associated with KDZ transposases domain-containing protein n=1 Tax=Melampsora larici-populina (strain 98AG31 / pathotype 3-4-7) TaxID=747676 RepID=F4RAM9_MELLP|nr:uncharacterized protein MELLADRAFT_103129 [Melampsora larici-populina 98AG31]EGG10510.1 hypothetical protein MELLADRAFT_103129 [Melampsora larici-populina 98AG31]
MADSTDIQGLYSKPAKKKPRKKMSRSAQQQAEMDKLDEEWQQPKINALHTALQPPVPDVPPAQDHPVPDLAYLLDLRLEDQPPPLNIDPHPNPDEQPNAPPQNFTQHVSSDDYHIRRLREYEQWKIVLRPMFVAYMQCADKTSEWWDEQVWNTDFHRCSCKVKEGSGRFVDLIDIFSRSAAHKLTKHESDIRIAQQTLAQLNQGPNAQPREYFADQWERKRTCLLAFSTDNTSARLEKTLARLIDLEEQLHSAHVKVTAIRSKRRNQRSASDVAELDDLPSSILLIENAMEEVACELGGDEFKNHPAVKGWDPLCPNRSQPIKLVHQSNLVSRKLHDESMTVLKVLHKNLLQKECRTWMVWQSHIPTLLLKTQQYSDTTTESDHTLLKSWQEILLNSVEVWEGMVKGPMFTAEALDQDEILEQQFFIGDGAADETPDNDDDGYEEDEVGGNDERDDIGQY